MTQQSNVSVVVLMYKGKVLLHRQEDNSFVANKKVWYLFGNLKESKDSIEHALRRLVEKETSISLQTISFIVSTQETDKKTSFYFSELTDTQVNNIQRNNGQELQFFTMKEITNLALEPQIKQFFANIELPIAGGLPFIKESLSNNS